MLQDFDPSKIPKGRRVRSEDKQMKVGAFMPRVEVQGAPGVPLVCPAGGRAGRGRLTCRTEGVRSRRSGQGGQ